MHPWLKDFDWESLNEYKIDSPFKPPKDENYDKKNSESEWKDINEDSLQHCIELLQKESVQELFANYEYDEADAK